MIDYAQHLIKLERLLKQAHDLCLLREYASAAAVMTEVTAESRLLTVTLTEMQRAKQRGDSGSAV